jgi:hypothetical protein
MKKLLVCILWFLSFLIDNLLVLAIIIIAILWMTEGNS